ncbi:MAG TPA: hypothetical protein VFE50_05600 [Cyclobacteriaceae bacterium]|nr:hypothetical protein [Cyclobacteriaceae bacterium]
MSYTISRHVRLVNIKTEKVTPNLRTQDFQRGDQVRESYNVRVAEFSNGASATIAQLEHYLTPNQDISVAINEFKQVIAIKNHVTGKSGMMFEKRSAKIKDILVSLLYIVPILAFGIWLSSKSIPYFKAGDDKGWILIVIGGGALSLGFFILKSVVKLELETKRALKELQDV